MTVDARALPRALAAVVAELEMTEATFVTLDEIRRICEDRGISSDASNIAWRLRRNGWLLPTETRGVWEFAPAANAGPYGRGDVFAELKGNLEREPSQDLRVALVSALWLYGWSERPPTRHEVAATTHAKVTSGLQRTYRVFRFDSRLPPVKKRNGTPLQSAPTVLVHLATHPSHVSSWEALELALPALIDTTDPQELRTEIDGRPATIAARLGYLLHAIAPGLVEDAELRPTPTVTYFGSRRQSGRFNSTWNVVDSILPFDPADLESP